MESYVLGVLDMEKISWLIAGSKYV